MEEEILSLIIHGCKLARNLESHLPHLTTTIQPPIALLNSCEEILKVFQVVNRLMNLSTDHDHHHLHPHPHPSSILSSMNINNIDPHDQAEPRPMSTELDASVQEWLKSSYTQAIETAAAAAQFSSIRNDIVDVHHHHHHHHKNPLISSSMLQEQQTQEVGLEMPILMASSNNNMISTSDGGSPHHRQSAGHHLHHHNELTIPDEAGSEYSGNNKTTTTTTTTTRATQPVVVQRSRKRKDGTNKRTVRVSGPRIGNMEIPPDDGFTWRKYGQKEILGSMFPRGYYRCTHKNFFGCEAKKQVQRLDLDPNTFEVTYYGIHTCQMGGITSIGAGGGRSGGFSSSSSSSQVLPPDDHDQYHTNMVVELVDAMLNTTTTASSTSGGGGGGSRNTVSMDSIFIPSLSQAQEQAHQKQHRLQHHQRPI